MAIEPGGMVRMSVVTSVGLDDKSHLRSVCLSCVVMELTWRSSVSIRLISDKVMLSSLSSLGSVLASGTGGHLQVSWRREALIPGVGKVGSGEGTSSGVDDVDGPEVSPRVDDVEASTGRDFEAGDGCGCVEDTTSTRIVVDTREGVATVLVDTSTWGGTGSVTLSRSDRSRASCKRTSLILFFTKIIIFSPLLTI